MCYDHARYGGVFHWDGRVMGFDINLPDKTTLRAAQAAVMAELPRDVRVVWSKTLDECVVFQLQSQTLSRVLHPRWSTWKGYLQVEYTSTGLGDPFNPRNVPGAILIDGNGDPADTTVC